MFCTLSWQQNDADAGDCVVVRTPNGDRPRTRTIHIHISTHPCAKVNFPTRQNGFKKRFEPRETADECSVELVIYSSIRNNGNKKSVSAMEWKAHRMALHSTAARECVTKEKTIKRRWGRRMDTSKISISQRIQVWWYLRRVQIIVIHILCVCVCLSVCNQNASLFQFGY